MFLDRLGTAPTSRASSSRSTSRGAARAATRPSRPSPTRRSRARTTRADTSRGRTRSRATSGAAARSGTCRRVRASSPAATSSPSCWTDRRRTASLHPLRAAPLFFNLTTRQLAFISAIYQSMHHGLLYSHTLLCLELQLQRMSPRQTSAAMSDKCSHA